MGARRARRSCREAGDLTRAGRSEEKLRKHEELAGGAAGELWGSSVGAMDREMMEAGGTWRQASYDEGESWEDLGELGGAVVELGGSGRAGKAVDS